jgi:hypothetical protein
LYFGASFCTLGLIKKTTINNCKNLEKNCTFMVQSPSGQKDE